MTWQDIIKSVSADHMRKTIRQILEGKWALGHGGDAVTLNFTIEYYAKTNKLTHKPVSHQLKILGNKGVIYKGRMTHKAKKLIVDVDKLDSLLDGDIRELMSVLSKMKR